MKVHLKIFYKFLLFQFVFSYSITFTQPISKQGEIVIISPANGRILHVDKREGISWINKSAINIDIEYSLDEILWRSIFSNLRAEIEVVSWKVPIDLANKSIKIRIRDSDSKGILDEIGYWLEVIDKPNLLSIAKTAYQQKVLKILPLGNSITFDNRSNDTRVIPDKFGYRLPLYNLLIKRGIKFDFIGSEQSGGNYLPTGFDENAGFPGISDDQLAMLMKTGRRLQPYHGIDEQLTPGPYLDIYSPDIILLHIGTNGITSTSGSATSNADVEDIIDEVKRYEDSKSTEIKIILARIIDIAPTNHPNVNTFNNNVQTMAMDRVTNTDNLAYPDRIIMADMEDGAGIDYELDPFGTVGNGKIGDMSDALHPNDKGFTKMAQVWFDGIIDILPKLSVKIYLEGAYTGLNSMSSDVNIQNNQPFDTIPWNYNGTEDAGTIPTNVVDWVLVSLREDTSKSSEVACRAGFLKDDGSIVDLDGTSPLAFAIEEGSYYVVVEHRNHLPIMSAAPVPIHP